ncbi:MAG: methylated-DNA--[Lentisphaeria bacterium]|nr:methylated-DNA--[protein]-cysteine S-methyltransferase [Lentisphaeria bacterium]
MICVSTPVGFMNIRSQGEKISSAEFTDRFSGNSSFSAAEAECARQLCEYFSLQRKSFDLPLLFEGTPFELAVWTQLSKIPYGETRSYSGIAAEIGNPGAARAVGMACHRNKLAILIPCHRVVGKSGKLVGYASGTDKKNILISLEKGKEMLFSGN